VEQHLGGLLEGWSGSAADLHRARWDEVRRGLSELDHRLHTNADHLRVFAGLVEDAQSGYDHALAAVGIATVAGIGLTLVTGGASDALAMEADGALGATVTAMIGEFQLAIGRMTALVAELADLMGALAARFAMDFAIRGPDLADGAAGGAATGIAFALADGERNLRDLALSGAVGGLVEGGRLGRRGGTGTVPDARRGGYGPTKPRNITDPYLRSIVDQLFRPGATMGRGGTADAVRDGAGHVQKAYDRAVQLGRWLERSMSVASPSDVHVAQVLLQDLLAALASEKFPIVQLTW
jgi:hypothetical protein